MKTSEASGSGNGLQNEFLSGFWRKVPLEFRPGQSQTFQIPAGTFIASGDVVPGSRFAPNKPSGLGHVPARHSRCHCPHWLLPVWSPPFSPPRSSGPTQEAESQDGGLHNGRRSGQTLCALDGQCFSSMDSARPLAKETVYWHRVSSSSLSPSTSLLPSPPHLFIGPVDST